MKPSLKRVFVAVTIAVALVAFFWMRSLASWRPVKWAKTSSNAAPVGYITKDGRIGLSLTFGEGTTFGDHIIDPKSGKAIAWPDENYILDFSQTAPERAFIANYDAEKIEVRDVRTAKLVRSLHWTPTNSEPHIAGNTDANILAMVDGDTFFLWSINSGQQRLRVHLSGFKDAAYEFYWLSSDGSRLVCCTEHGGTIWNAHSGQVLRSWSLSGHKDPLLLFLSKDARVVAYEDMGQNNTNRYFFIDGSTGKVLWQMQKPTTTTLFQGDLDDDELFLSESKQCEVFDLLTGRLKRELPGPRLHDGDVVRATHDYIYTSEMNGQVLRWRAR